MSNSEKTAKELSLEQEERVSKFFGATRTPRSGGGAWKKGDCLSEDWFLECKTTVKPSLSYSVNKSVLDKADHERSEMHKPYYALAFTLGEDREDYFVVNKRTMRAFLDQTAGIKSLIATLEKELEELDSRFAKMNSGISQPSQQDKALYMAHRTEKSTLIEELRRII